MIAHPEPLVVGLRTRADPYYRYVKCNGKQPKDNLFPFLFYLHQYAEKDGRKNGSKQNCDWSKGYS